MNLAVLGAQWGDEGKGKVVDLLAPRFNVVARYQGGHNAGHTVYVSGQKFVLHLIPSGILRPEVTCVIGNGTVIDLDALLSEVEMLASLDIEVGDRLRISGNAHVIMPYHIILDGALSGHQGNLAAGSTRRGIAPVYADKMYRNGIRMIDLLEPDVFREKLEKGYTFSKGLIEKALGQSLDISIDEIFDSYIAYGQLLKSYICDTSVELYNAHKSGKSILFEGAQGISLDVDHGIYPYTTSSNTAAGHISTGTGVSFRDIDRIIGVVKAYLSRVGESPLPSEIHGDDAKSLRDKGLEYGTTTGRPRRVGWLDLVQVRQAVRVNGLTEIALTKLDVLNGFKKLSVCVAYDVNGEHLTEMPASLTQYRKAKPIYETLPCWGDLPENIWDKGFNALPDTLKDYIAFIEREVDCPIKIVSVGPQRHETIIR
ncbi:MAG TPA: adenylosuccinate synthase [Acidobacteria bacterium]|nr:adenylosuccinate synthase [Acidobacteriota bacterium]